MSTRTPKRVRYCDEDAGEDGEGCFEIMKKELQNLMMMMMVMMMMMTTMATTLTTTTTTTTTTTGRRDDEEDDDVDDRIVVSGVAAVFATPVVGEVIATMTFVSNGPWHGLLLCCVLTVL